MKRMSFTTITLLAVSIGLFTVRMAFGQERALPEKEIEKSQPSDETASKTLPSVQKAQAGGGTAQSGKKQPGGNPVLQSGETVHLDINTLPASESVTITFEVTVNNPFPAAVTQVSNQGTVSGTNFASVLTDDPDVGGAADPTVTGIVNITRALTNLGPAVLFMGVTNSDNNGRRIDIKLEIFKNGTAVANKLAEGTLANVQLTGNALNNSRKFTVALSPVGSVGFADNDILYAILSVRRVGGSGNFGVRFWYNTDSVKTSSQGWSRMRKVTTGGIPANHYYFLTGSLLGTVPNHSGIASVLTATTAYQSFGTWSIQGSLMRPWAATEEVPSKYALDQNYPNPFNPSTTIQFDLPEESNVRIVIYDILGREVTRVVDGMMGAGRYSQTWNGQDGTGRSVASGVYIVRIEARSVLSERNLVSMRKMMLMK